MASNGPALQEAHPQAQAAARGSSVGQGSAASIASGQTSACISQLHGAREDTLNF